MSAGTTLCAHCAGADCRLCRTEAELLARAGGDQGATPAELALDQLRAELAAVKAERDSLRVSYDQAFNDGVEAAAAAVRGAP